MTVPIPFLFAPTFRAFDSAGNSLAGGLLYTYAANTLTPQTTWNDALGATPNTNPVILDSTGSATVRLSSAAYKFVLKDSSGTTQWTQDFYQANYLIQTDIVILLGADPITRQTSAEIAAGVTPLNFAYQPYDLRRYYSGSGTYDAAMASAIAVCNAGSGLGGTIRVAPGLYTFASQVNLQNALSVIIQGDSGPTAGAQPAVRFVFTGTGSGSWFNCNSAAGVQFKGIQFIHTNAGFTGTYFTFNHGSPPNDSLGCGLFDCTLGNSVSATTHLNLDTANGFTAERCSFQQGSPSVQGQAHAGGSYSNRITFRDCTWLNNITVPIQDLGQAWSFIGCIFENLVSGAPGALTTNGLTTFSSGLLMTGCWLGDATVAGTWISGFHNGATFTGNYISGIQASTVAFSLSAPSGVVITGNTLQGLLTALNFVAAGGGGHGVIFTGNLLSSVTNPVTNPANMDLEFVFNPNSPQLAPPTGKGAFNGNGFEVSPNGVIRQWGTVAVTTSTPVSVTFATNGIAFPNSCFNVVIGFNTQSGANSASASAVSTTGFTANVGGTAGANSLFWQAVGN
jgi:hypothetical protein